MPASVLGLGAAAMGAAAFGADAMMGFDKPKDQKKTKVTQPSAEDYLQGYLGLAYGKTNKLYSSQDDRIKASFGTGPVIGAAGNIFYGGQPTEVPKGYTAMRGPDISVKGRGRNEGMTTRNVETYTLLPLQQPQQPQQKKESSIDLTQGGRGNRLNTKDINYAMEQGKSLKDIRQTVKSEGTRMSAKAKAQLFKNKKNKDN
jgi:hypothetical protein